MEVFDCYDVEETRIILKNEKQLESLYDCIKAGKEVLLRWTDEDGEERSRLFITEELLTRLTDGRFIIESRKGDEE